jgi:hypothetical protein
MTTNTTNERTRPSVADVRAVATVTVPEGGAFLGLGRAASYEAARAGTLPTLRVGKRLLVPTAGLLRLVGLDPDRSEPAEA